MYQDIQPHFTEKILSFTKGHCFEILKLTTVNFHIKIWFQYRKYNIYNFLSILIHNKNKSFWEWVWMSIDFLINHFLHWEEFVCIQLADWLNYYCFASWFVELLLFDLLIGCCFWCWLLIGLFFRHLSDPALMAQSPGPPSSTHAMTLSQSPSFTFGEKLW